MTSSSTTQWATAALDPQSLGRSIPSSFLGISHEWTNVEELNHGGSYLQLLQDLTAYGSGPLVLRVGGGSTDMLTDMLPNSTWRALQELHSITSEHGGSWYSDSVNLRVLLSTCVRVHIVGAAGHHQQTCMSQRINHQRAAHNSLPCPICVPQMSSSSLG